MRPHDASGYFGYCTVQLLNQDVGVLEEVPDDPLILFRESAPYFDHFSERECRGDQTKFALLRFSDVFRKNLNAFGRPLQ